MRGSSDVESAFAACLERVEQGANVADVLRDYPRYRQELEPLLFDAKCLSRLFDQPAPPNLWLPEQRRRRGWRPHPLWPAALHLPQVFRVAALAVLLALVLSIVGVATASALPGQPGYPVKRAIERAWLAVAIGDHRVGVAVALAERRLDEAEALREKGLTGEPALEGLLELEPMLVRAGGPTATAIAARRRALGARMPDSDESMGATPVPRSRVPTLRATSTATVPAPTRTPTSIPSATPLAGVIPPSPTRPVGPAPIPSSTSLPATAPEPTQPRPTETRDPEPSDTQQPVQETPQPTTDPGETGLIEGRVTLGDGSPAALAEVEAVRLLEPPGELPRRFGDRVIRYTDSEGRFRFFLDPGMYVVGAGPVPRVWWDSRTSEEKADVLQLAEGETLDGVDFHLAGTE